MKSKKKSMIILTSILVVIGIMAALFAWYVKTNATKINPITGHIDHIEDYFGGGKGTADEPYLIKEPEHLKNLAWLQYMGYFNQAKADDATKINQVYFQLNAENEDKVIDMSDWTLPPIGSSDNPFVGNFDGNGNTIKGLTVTNQMSIISGVSPVYHDNDNKSNVPKAVAQVYNVECIGLFGIVGSGQGYSGLGYDSTVTAVKNFYINDLTVDVETKWALAGVAAAYVNGTLEGVGVENSTINNEQNAGAMTGITSNLSEYFLIGYCTEDYLEEVENTVTDIYEPTRVELKAEISKSKEVGEDWGDNAVTIKELFERVTQFRTNATAVKQSNAKWITFKREVKKDGKIEIKWEEAKQTRIGTIGTTLTSNNYKNYTGTNKEGSASFKNPGFSTTGNIEEQYLTGYTQEPTEGSTVVTIYEETKVDKENKEVTIGYTNLSGNIVYLGITADPQIVDMETVDNVQTGVAWLFSDAKNKKGSLSTQVKDGETTKTYYLTRNDGALALSETADANWHVEDKKLYYGTEETYLEYNLEAKKWQLKTEDGTKKGFYIADEGNYLTYSGGNLTISSDPASATQWTITDDFKVYTEISNQKYYLQSGDDVQVVTSSDTATTYKIQKSQTQVTSLSVLSSHDTISLISNNRSLGYDSTTQKWKMKDPVKMGEDGKAEAPFVIQNGDGTCLGVKVESGQVVVTRQAYDTNTTQWKKAKEDKPSTTVNGVTYYLYWNAQASELVLDTNEDAKNYQKIKYKHKEAWLIIEEEKQPGQGGPGGKKITKYLYYTTDQTWQFAEQVTAEMGRICQTTTEYFGFKENLVLLKTDFSSELDFSSHESYFRISKDTSSTIDVPETYLPTNVKNGYSTDTENNAGYFVSGANAQNGDLTLAKSTLKTFLNNSSDTDNYDKSNFQIATINYKSVNDAGQATYVQIEDTDNTGYTSQGTTYNKKMSPETNDLNLQRYTTAKSNWTTLMEGSAGSIYGLEFDQSSVSLDNVATINQAGKTIFVRKQRGKDQKVLGDTESYQLPRNSVDVQMWSSGYINVFAGTFDTCKAGETYNFFSLYKIKREDKDNSIKELKRVNTIYKIEKTNPQSDTTIEFKCLSECENPPQTERHKTVTQIFDMDWLENPQNYTGGQSVIGQACYYFEIPVEQGEYALSAAYTDAAHSAYLMYLDIGTSQQDATARYTEAVKTITNTYDVPKGVYFSSESNQACSYFALDGKGTTTASCEGSTVKVSDENTLSQMVEGEYFIRADSFLSYKDTELDINQAKAKTTRNVVTQTISEMKEEWKSREDGSYKPDITIQKQFIKVTTNGTETWQTKKYEYEKKTGAIKKINVENKVGDKEKKLLNAIDLTTLDTALEYGYYNDQAPYYHTSMSKMLLNLENVSEDETTKIIFAYDIIENLEIEPFTFYIREVLEKDKLNEEGGYVEASRYKYSTINGRPSEDEDPISKGTALQVLKVLTN